jgi:type IV secretion system protein TrbG
MKTQSVQSMMLCSVLGLVGSACASKQAPAKAPVYVEATKQPAPISVPVAVAVPVIQPVPGQARPLPPMGVPSAMEEDAARIMAQGKKPAQIIEEAAQQARREPAPDGYFNALQRYEYEQGVLYQVYSSPLHVTMLTFEPGEKVQDLASGDVTRWIMMRSSSGEGEQARDHLMIKPMRPNLHTNIAVVTNKRVYHLELRSYAETYMAEVSWRYPYGELLQQLAQPSQVSAAAPANSGVTMGREVAQLCFAYAFVVPTRKPAWMPQRVFHDGKRTYIQFAPGTGERALPALFLLSEQGTPELATYKVEQDAFVVDRVVEVAQLRLGDQDAPWVGIELERDALEGGCR